VMREPEDLDAEKQPQHDESMAVHTVSSFASRARLRAVGRDPAITSGGSAATP
jgi:hypothetical protein